MTDSVAIGNSVVVTPAEGVVYVMADDGIVAREIASGRTRWTSAGATKPLVQAGPALVALAGTGQVVLLDAASGEPYAPCPVIAGVTIEIFDTATTRYRSRGSALDGRVTISWWRNNEAGTYLIDVAAGTAIPGPPVPSVYASRSEPGRSIVAVELRDGSTTELVRLAGGGMRLVHGAIAIDLPARDPHDINYGISADRSTIAVGSPSTREVAYYDLATGELLVRGSCAEFPYDGQLVGGVAVVVTRDVAACAVATGATLWRQRIRHTEHFSAGPHP
jgi:hypothetical protein